MQTTTHRITTPKAPASDPLVRELRELRDALFRAGRERAALTVAAALLEVRRWRAAA